MVMELLCLIYAEKYLRYHDATAFHEYHRYSEENRGSIFWKDTKSEWDYDSLLITLLIEEQKLNSENKHLKIQYPIPHELLAQNLNDLRLVSDRIREKYPVYYANAFNRETPSMEEIQDSLNRNDATLISFDIIENKIFILWIQKSAKELFKIDLTPLREEQLKTLIEWMSTRNMVEASEYALLANTIWTWLIPDRIKADENARWIIIPDGYFHI
jgi:hypothetical protein